MGVNKKTKMLGDNSIFCNTDNSNIKTYIHTHEKDRKRERDKKGGKEKKERREIRYDGR